MLQRVVRSTVIDAPIERVWAVLRDFNSHDRWHGVVEHSRIEGRARSDQVGCVRSFTLKDGHRIREQLLALDDREHRSTYRIVEATVPLQRYVATVTLKPVTDGDRTFWHWESTFATPPGQARELREMVAVGVYEAGFEHLRRHLDAGGDLGAPRDSEERAGRRPAPAARPSPAAAAVPSRGVRLERYGGAGELRPHDGQAAAPGPGELRLRQRAIGVNFLDVYLRKGWMPTLLPLPGVPGMEAAGEVLDVGAGVTAFLPGDRVAYLGPQPGAYCSVRTVPAAWAVRLPPAVDDDTAAALLLKGLTADVLLRDVGRVGPGTRVLLHAAAGGVGQLLAPWARQLGAVVIGTVGSDDKARLARERGCEHVIVAREPRFARTVQDLWGGADLIVDGLGDAARDENFAALAPCGHWVSLGQATGALAPLSPEWLAQKSATFSRPVVFAYTADAAVLGRRAERLWEALAAGHLPPLLIERHALAAAAQAHERLESRRTAGALVLQA